MVSTNKIYCGQIRGLGVLRNIRNRFAVDVIAVAVRRLNLNEFCQFETPIDFAKIREEMLMKAPVNVGSIDGSTWGDALAPYLQSYTAFIQSLPPVTGFDRILSDGGFTRMPLRTRIAIASSAAIGHAVSELAAKPISAMNLSTEYLTADLRGLSMVAAEAKVAVMIAQWHELILLDHEFSFVGRGIAADVRLSKVALERARLAIVRDKLLHQFHAFVETQTLVR
jgi:hypothetical protein